MIALNHALTGAVIGLAVQQPVVALPVALASHFVCDVIPHYGRTGAENEQLQSKSFNRQLVLDAAACVMLVGVLALTAPMGWVIAAASAFVATLPDFAWLPGYLRVRRGGNFRTSTTNLYMKFAAQIQWFERPSGAVVEVLWAIAMMSLLATYL
jgi:hypothetical protein